MVAWILSHLPTDLLIQALMRKADVVRVNVEYGHYWEYDATNEC